MPNNASSMKNALKSVPGLADVGVPQGDGDGPIPPPRCLEVVWKKFLMTNFDVPNNVSSIKKCSKIILQGTFSFSRNPDTNSMEISQTLPTLNGYRIDILHNLTGPLNKMTCCE